MKENKRANHRNIIYNPQVPPESLSEEGKEYLEYFFATTLRKQIKLIPDMSYLYLETNYQGKSYAYITSQNITGCPNCDLAIGIIGTQMRFKKPKTKEEIHIVTKHMNRIISCN